MLSAIPVFEGLKDKSAVSHQSEHDQASSCGVCSTLRALGPAPENLRSASSKQYKGRIKDVGNLVEANPGV